MSCSPDSITNSENTNPNFYESFYQVLVVWTLCGFFQSFFRQKQFTGFKIREKLEFVNSELVVRSGGQDE